MKSLTLTFSLLLALSATAADSAPTLRAREGWTVKLIAQAPDIRHPSVVCAAPDGRVFVAEDPMDISSRSADVREGKILCFHPDGTRTVFAEQLHAVFGMQYLEGKLYVLHNPFITVFKDDGAVGREAVELIKQTNPNPWAGDWNDHIPANFRLGMDGFFYIATGDKGFVGMTGTDGRKLDLREGGVIRMRPDGTGLEVVCRGVRNILDLAMNAEDEMFTYDNTDEHNWMGRATHMIEGGFYGYPFDFVPQQPHTLWMMADYGAGAACGALVWNNEALPEKFRGNLILSDFGQRNLRRVRMERRGGTFAAVENENLFIEPPGDFRPVGIGETVEQNGCYICDWQEADIKAPVTVGRLWKLTLDAAPATSLPAWWPALAAGKAADATEADLIIGLAHPFRSVRLTAQRELARRLPASAGALRGMLADEHAGAPARSHALWALGASPAEENGLAILAAAASPDVAVRRQSLRWLGGHPASSAALAALVTELKSDDASLRRVAATALGRVGGAGEVAALLAALEQDDLFARYAAFTALNRIGQRLPESWSVIAAGLGDASARIREGTRFALRETYDEALASVLCGLVKNAGTGVRPAAVELLAATTKRRPIREEYWGIHPALGAPPLKNETWAATPQILSTLRAALDDAAPAPRRAAALALGQAKDASAEDALLRLLTTDAETSVRQAALTALASLESVAAATVVAALLGDDATPAALRQDAIAASTVFKDPAVTSALLAQLEKAGGAEHAKAIIVALGGRGDGAAVPPLTALAKDREPLRPAALAALGEIATPAALAALNTLTEELDAADQPAIIRALASTRRAGALPALVAAWKNPGTRAEALDGLLAQPSVLALDAYLDGLASPQVALREKCRRAIAAIAAEAWPVLESRTEPFAGPLVAELRTVFAQNPAALASPKLQPSAAAPAAHTAAEYDAHARTHPGDPWRGQHIFLDATRTACTACHAVGGHGAAIGPELDTIGAQFSREALVESILYPSKTVRKGYEQVVIETTDGQTNVGAIRGEGPEHVVLVDLQGQSQNIAKKTIRTRQTLPYSLMPEGLHAAWSLDEFADLVAYVSSLKVNPLLPASAVPPTGFTALFNGRDLTGWREFPNGTKRLDAATFAQGSAPQHWSAKNGVLEHDGVTGDLWSEREFGDFELTLEWRWPDQPVAVGFPIIDASGQELALVEKVLDAGDSGVLLRGLYKAQANLFCYPVGSGEFWEYRESLTGEARRAVTPKVRADRPLGQWNDMSITLRGNRVTVVLNGQTVIENAQLPDLPERGPIGFQHEHGKLQIRSVAISEIP